MEARNKKDFFSVIKQVKDKIYTKVKDFFQNMPENLEIFLTYIKKISEELEKKDLRAMAQKAMNVLIFVVQGAIHINKNAGPIIKDFAFKFLYNYSLKEAGAYISKNLQYYKNEFISIYGQTSTQILTVVTALFNFGLNIYDYNQITKLIEEIEEQKFADAIKNMKEQFYLHQSCFQEELDNVKYLNTKQLLKNLMQFLKRIIWRSMI